jgi:hypothetical protein
MEPYILFALLVIGVPTPTDRVTWTAEFVSQQSCEAAGSSGTEVQQYAGKSTVHGFRGLCVH